jgi:hypothetical protein
MKQDKNSLKKLQLRIISHYDDEIIDNLYHSFSSPSHNYDLDGLKDSDLSDEEKTSIINDISDREYISKLTRNLIFELQILALYKTIEIKIKEMLNFSGLINKNDIDACYNYEKLKVTFNTHFCDFTSLTKVDAYNELRCINNCIKHSGKVNKELAKFPNWVVNQNLPSLQSSYDRLKDEVKIFMKSMATEIISKTV